MHPKLAKPEWLGLRKLSIPFAWDFSMHRFMTLGDMTAVPCLSIPFAWDFSMHLPRFFGWPRFGNFSFNSLCLGFFHASLPTISQSVAWLLITFNSLCLGFFHASFAGLSLVSLSTVTFNSLCLGFFHASGASFDWGGAHPPYFQFPLLGIFPCICQM